MNARGSVPKFIRKPFGQTISAPYLFAFCDNRAAWSRSIMVGAHITIWYITVFLSAIYVGLFCYELISKVAEASMSELPFWAQISAQVILLLTIVQAFINIFTSLFRIILKFLSTLVYRSNQYILSNALLTLGITIFLGTIIYCTFFGAGAEVPLSSLTLGYMTLFVSWAGLLSFWIKWRYHRHNFDHETGAALHHLSAPDPRQLLAR